MKIFCLSFLPFVLFLSFPTPPLYLNNRQEERGGRFSNCYSQSRDAYSMSSNTQTEPAIHHPLYPSGFFMAYFPLSLFLSLYHRRFFISHLCFRDSSLLVYISIYMRVFGKSINFFTFSLSRILIYIINYIFYIYKRLCMWLSKF